MEQLHQNNLDTKNETNVWLIEIKHKVAQV